MNITWYGQSCFKISAKEADIVVDPFDSKIGLKPPRSEADIVTISHAHYDHNNKEAVKGDPVIVDGPGEYSIKGVEIKGVESYHDKNQGQERGLNTIYTIEAEGIKICHMGDLGHILSGEEIGKIGSVDILMVPIGGVYTINTEEAIEVINQVEPRIVIPMHYKIEGLNVNLDKIDLFAKEMGASPSKAVNKLSIKKKDLPSQDTEVVIMKVG